MESRSHEEEEADVGGSKHPSREIVEEQLVQPVGDEPVLRPWPGAIAGPQRILPDGQRAPDAEHALETDDANENKVKEPEIEVSHKGPAAKMADPDDRQGADIEHHNEGVQDEDDISQAGRK